MKFYRLLFLLIISVKVWANVILLPDTSYFSAHAVKINTREQTNTKLLFETIEITVHKDSFDVTVKENFLYMGNEDFSITLLFPSWLNEKEVIRAMDNPQFYVNTMKKAIKRIYADINPYNIHEFYSVKATFEPDTNTATFKYSSRFDNYSEYLIIDYLIGTGCIWDGPIGRIEVRLKFDYPHMPVGAKIGQKRYDLTPKDDNTYEFIIENIEPLFTDKILIYLKKKTESYHKNSLFKHNLKSSHF